MALCVGTESMSRNPLASYTQRAGFRMGQVDFRDFLWEATRDTAPGIGMGDTAENLARRYTISREETDRYAARSFARASAAWESGWFDAEVSTVTSSQWTLEATSHVAFAWRIVWRVLNGTVMSGARGLKPCRNCVLPLAVYRPAVTVRQLSTGRRR